MGGGRMGGGMRGAGMGAAWVWRMHGGRWRGGGMHGGGGHGGGGGYGNSEPEKIWFHYQYRQTGLMKILLRVNVQYIKVSELIPVKIPNPFIN